MSEPLIDIRPDHWVIVADILRRHVPDREVWAFGSRAKWNAKDYSDLDLAVIGETPLSLSVIAALADDFAECDLPFKVDVVDWATTSEAFREVIRRDKVVVQRAAKHPVDGETGEWTVRPLDDCVAALIDYRGKTPRKTSFGIPLITAKVVKGGRIETPDEFIAVDDYEPWMRRGIPKSGDVVITTEAPLAEVAQLGPEDVALAQRLIVLRGKEGLLENAFLKFLMQSEEVQQQLRARASGTTVLGIKQSELRKVLLSLPPIKEQRAIAHILGSLDDKIELNRRMNETLEAIARALFQSWFVNFDPVRAKQPKNVGWVIPSGRNPQNKADGGLRGYAANPPYEFRPPIADLFPARLVDSELGEIPEGWGVAPLPEVIDVNPTRALRKGDVAPYLDMANMPTRGHSPDSVIDRPFGSGMRFVNGDTLVARITPCLENGKTAYVDFLDDDQVGWGSTEYIVLRPKTPLPAEFAYCLARGSEFRDFAIQSMTGSSGRQRVPAESLSHFHMVAAPKPIAELFGRLIKPLFAHASAGAKESRTLAALRDTLLPKLISGEIRVKDTEKIVGIAG